MYRAGYSERYERTLPPPPIFKHDLRVLVMYTPLSLYLSPCVIIETPRVGHSPSSPAHPLCSTCLGQIPLHLPFKHSGEEELSMHGSSVECFEHGQSPMHLSQRCGVSDDGFRRSCHRRRAGRPGLPVDYLPVSHMPFHLFFFVFFADDSIVFGFLVKSWGCCV